MLSNSKLGFGLMRLPKDEHDKIDIKHVEKMVDAFMDKGFTYFDTAYAYAGSENAIREALVKRYPRDTYTLADKLPGWKLTCEEDVERIFNESLEACGVDYFDFYLIHSIEKKNIDIYKKYHAFDFVKKMKAEGKIKHIGFSFHDSPELLESLFVEYPEMDFVQLQLNYLDWENPVIHSRENYEVARKYNKPIVVMEPVKGGRLVDIVDNAKQVFTNYDASKSIASWALRYVSTLEGVMTVLSGMSNTAQMNDNLNTYSPFVSLNKEEVEMVENVREIILEKPTIPCTACRYCTPGCPMSISIPDLFAAYNLQTLYGVSGRYKEYYHKYCDESNNAASCIGCGQCESVCPQHISIIDELKNVSDAFD